MTVLDGVVADVLLPLGCREQRVWFKRPRLVDSSTREA
jgi:hypothetical protein